MGWLVSAKVGDVFRWQRTGVLCRITEFRDYGCQINFVYLTGRLRGQRGYTLLPQDIEPASAIELLGALVSPG